MAGKTYKMTFNLSDGSQQTVEFTAPQGPPGPATMVKLWENPNPAESFAAQTVAVDLTGFDLYEIIYAPNTSYYTREMSTKARVGNGALLIGLWADTDRIFHRSVTTAAGGLSFAAAWENKANNNSYCIPIAIYGVKETEG